MKFIFPALRFVLLAAILNFSSRLLAQTNSFPVTNAPAAALQIWDYSEELELTDTQRMALEKIHARYDSSRATLRAINEAELPPDAKTAQRREAAEKIRAVNRDIAALLTNEQKEKWADLRGEKTRTARRNIHPLFADAEYKKLADDLRGAYSLPPTNWPAPNLDDEAKTNFAELGLLPPVVYPTNNPFSSAKAELGKKLYFDPRLSGSGQMACASCHDADLAFADGRTVSFGHARKELKRNAPSILNAGQLHVLFWDGRAGSLEQQAQDVIQNQDEMHSDVKSVGAGLEKIPGYTNDFAAAFGSPETSLTRAAEAIATFERTVTTRPNSFDSFLRGDTNALGDEAMRGLHLFRTTARCLNCHNGPNFTDGQFHNEGLTYYGRKLEDLGRYLVTTNAADVGKFKTPSLRNIARTAPYMHNGLFDLDGVLNMYNAGMATVRPKESQKMDPLFPVKSPLLKPLGLNKQELADLKAFLDSLTETRVRIRPPEMPPGAL